MLQHRLRRSLSLNSLRQNSYKFAYKSFPNLMTIDKENISKEQLIAFLSQRPSEMESSERLTEWWVDPNAFERTEEFLMSSEASNKLHTSNSAKEPPMEDPLWIPYESLQTSLCSDCTSLNAENVKERFENLRELTEKNNKNLDDKNCTKRSKQVGGKVKQSIPYNKKVRTKNTSNSKKRASEKIVPAKKPQKTPIGSINPKNESKEVNTNSRPTCFDNCQALTIIWNKQLIETPNTTEEKDGAALPPVIDTTKAAKDRKKHRHNKRSNKKMAFDCTYDPELINTLCTAADKLKRDLIKRRNRKLKHNCIRSLAAEKPEKPKTAFQHFVESARITLSLPMPEDSEWINKLAGVWKSLSAPEKAIYKVKAIEDIKMYEEKTAIWEQKLKRLGILSDLDG